MAAQIARDTLSAVLLPETVARVGEMHRDLKVDEVPDVGHAPTFGEPRGLGGTR